MLGSSLQVSGKPSQWMASLIVSVKKAGKCLENDWADLSPLLPLTPGPSPSFANTLQSPTLPYCFSPAVPSSFMMNGKGLELLRWKSRQACDGTVQEPR